MTQGAAATGAEVRADEFRAACAQFTTGVTVVTTSSPDGDFGVTVNSFTSLSLEPPQVLICLAQTSNTWAAIERTGAFAVNVLAADQVPLARLFASKRPDKFARARPSLDPSTAAADSHGGHGTDGDAHAQPTDPPGNQAGPHGGRAGADGTPPPEFVTHRGAVGVPLLDGALATLECRLVDAFPSGTHTIIVGRVVGLDHDPAKGPALFFRSRLYEGFEDVVTPGAAQRTPTLRDQ